MSTQSEKEFSEEQTRRLVQTALAGPARPLRADQVEALVRLATQRRGWPAPLGLLAGLVTGALAVCAVGVFAAGGPLPTGSPGLLELALLVPAANLLLSPLAAYFVVKGRKK